MKANYTQIRDLQDSISKTGWRAHYVLGAYEVMLASLITDLPASKQKDALDALKSLHLRVLNVETGE